MFGKICITLKITAICLLSAMSVAAFSQSAEQIKTAMKQRLSKIGEFKKNGVLGENNLGYLTVRTTNAEAEKLAEAENADRKKVYEAIAKKTKADAAQVGRQRAVQIIQRGNKGEWFKNDKGEWFAKK